MPANRVLRFETNVPVQLALPVMQGLPIIKGEKREELLVTVDGLRFNLPAEAAERLRNIARADEPFMLCRRHGRFEFWLSNQAERQRAADEAPEVREGLRSGGKGAVVTPGSGMCRRSQPADEPAATPPPVPPTDPAPIRLGRETVIDFPAPKSRPDQEPLKPTGTDSLPVPRLQTYAGGSAEIEEASAAPSARRLLRVDRDERSEAGREPWDSACQPVRIRPALGGGR